eukprot:TRINITY_DN5869_c0_g1_i1.p1 TRINITY_DN5869_c0_g1~~TRINITY_DN5869_c0_g1_i1.p1  ORF type:complete len:396 (-),score=49.89 TRINITY_DN5869_c0_g1_i1:215-1375(-)
MRRLCLFHPVYKIHNLSVKTRTTMKRNKFAGALGFLVGISTIALWGCAQAEAEEPEPVTETGLVQTTQVAVFTRLLRNLQSQSSIVKRSTLRTLVSMSDSPSAASTLWELGFLDNLWSMSDDPMFAPLILSCVKNLIVHSVVPDGQHAAVPGFIPHQLSPKELQQWASFFRTCAGNSELSYSSLHSIAVVVDHLVESHRLQHSTTEDTTSNIDSESLHPMLYVLSTLLSNPTTWYSHTESSRKKAKKTKITTQDELILTTNRALNTLCARGQTLKEEMIKLGIPNLIFTHWLPFESDGVDESVIERNQLYVSRLVADLQSVNDAISKEHLLSPECLSFLRSCSKSKNKQIRLNILKILGNFCKDGEYLSCLSSLLLSLTFQINLSV